MKPVVIVLLALFVVTVCIAIIVVAAYNTKKKPRIIYTCTTYFDSPVGNKWKAFKRGIDSLLHNHPNIRKQVQKWYVVNEPGPNNYEAKMASRYPWIEFVQKTDSQRGQAASLNLIRAAIRPYDLWLQWEESWYATRPFLKDAIDIVTKHKLTQLQFTMTPPDTAPNWSALSTPVNEIWARVPLTNHMVNSMMNIHHPRDLKHVPDGWPLFSLLPSLNDVKFHASLALFDEDPKLWPWKFEWAYAKQWAANGGTKGIFRVAPVTRSPLHVSTYALKSDD